MAHTLSLDPLYPEMEEASIGRWLVQVGDTITDGQPIAELITDKVAYEFASPVAGTVLAVLPSEKSVVPVGSALAVVGMPGEAVADLAALEAENRRLLAAREATLTETHQVTAVQQTAPAPRPSGGQVRATPAARRLARERGIDLATLRGSGPDGMITVDDLP